MQWFGKGSNNVDDRRGGGGLAIGGGLGIVIVVLGLLFGQDFTGILNQTDGFSQQAAKDPNDPDDPGKKFVSGVLESTEIVWGEIFREQGATYEEPRLELFEGRVMSGCGSANASVGPFYCPANAKIYIDLSFFKELSDRFGAAGDFAQAYVIAHEVGHHVQNLMGTSEKMAQMRTSLSEVEYNKLSVSVELQADFFAGVWANRVQRLDQFVLEAGDLEEALRAANAIGDDRLQKISTGEVVPDSFTHGTSAQRMFWFKKGLETGDITQGDTFNNNF